MGSQIVEYETHSSTNIYFLPGDFSDDEIEVDDYDFGHPLDSSNIWFDPKDFSDDDFEPEDYNDHSGLDRSSPNIFFNREDFSDEEDIELNCPSDSTEDSEEVRSAEYTPPQAYTAHSSPPELSQSHRRPRTIESHDAYIESLLVDKNAPITKEDLALFAQMISDRYKREQENQVTEAQRIKGLKSQDRDHESESEDADHECNNTGKVRGRRAKKPRSGSKKELSDLVRKFAVRLMKRPKPVGHAKLSPITSVTAQEVKAFLDDPSNSKRGPTKKRFILDFNDRSGPASPWNKRATQIFAKEFMKAHPDAGHSEVLVAGAFKTHVFYLKRQFLRYLQYVDDVSAMGDQAAILISHENSVHNSRMARRKGLLQRRIEACTKFLHHADILKFEQIWQMMPVEAMSGDETDHYKGVNRYIITKLPWRAAWIHEWMLVFDRLHLLQRFSETGRAKPGAFPHIRILGSGERIDRECITPPIGLPRNFYCPDWLSKQTPAFIQSLQMLDPIDLLFSEKLIRMASSCKYVTSHKTPPTPL